MAPVFVTTIAMPVGLYPSFAKIPTATATPFLTLNAVPSRGSAANTPSTPSSSTGLEIFLIISVVLVLLGTMIIVWLCFRCCTSTRVPPASEQTAVKLEPENAAGRPKMIQEAHIIPNTWDGSHAFWVKRTMPNPDLITATQTKMNEALLSEVPNVWRILGRPKSLRGALKRTTQC
ncbi:hypothetical protein B0H13DRAFT_2325850 [Mycena leptocephala]|nr:hypothetical protein B0H13DRAFT_2325850 [Mycena leptocephala]